MKPIFKLNLPSSSPLEELEPGVLSQRVNRGSNWKRRINENNKSNCRLFTKNNKTTHTQISDLSQQCSSLTTRDLAQEVKNKQHYLQELISQIVRMEDEHKDEMNRIDSEYEEKISNMHELLRQSIERNRQLQSEIEKYEDQAQGREPRISNDSLLLGRQSDLF